MVHVGTVDAPVTVGDVKQIVTEFRKAVGNGEERSEGAERGHPRLGLRLRAERDARQDAEKAGIDLRLVRIPERSWTSEPSSRATFEFFELAALSVGLKKSGRKVTLSIDDFVIPLDDVPAESRRR